MIKDLDSSIKFLFLKEIFSFFNCLLLILVIVPSHSKAQKIVACSKILSDKVQQPANPFHLKDNVTIAMAQMNPTIGQFDRNVDKAIGFIKQAALQKVDIVAFPELTLSGYLPRDLLLRNNFLDLYNSAIQKLLERVQNIPNAPRTIMLGAVTLNDSPIGLKLKNSMLVIQDGKIVHTQSKRLLPNYDIFYENRYFEPELSSNIWESQWGSIGCTICEDAWAKEKVQGRYIYANDPAEDLKGVNLAVNISASPFYRGKVEKRQRVIGDFAKRLGSLTVYVNQVGANDDVIYDGSSAIYGPDGKVLFQMPVFQESLGVVKLHKSQEKKGFQITESSQYSLNDQAMNWSQITTAPFKRDMDEIQDAIVIGIRDYFKKTKFTKAVVAISGGIDSATVASLTVMALGKENVIGLLMPGPFSSKGSITDALELAENLGISTVTIPISTQVKLLGMQLSSFFSKTVKILGFTTAKDDTTEDNLQSRMRKIIELAFGNKFFALVMNTSNKSELAIGQATSFGDMGGALSPIGDLFKTEVYELAYYLNSKKHRIPIATLTKPASGELGFNPTDEEKFGPFKILDQVLRMYLVQQMGPKEIVARGFDPEYVANIIQIVKDNEFKRRLTAIVLKLSPYGFGPGRLYPVAADYQEGMSQYEERQLGLIKKSQETKQKLKVNPGQYDVTIVGAGAHGVAFGISYLKVNPEARILFIEKDNTVSSTFGKHQNFFRMNTNSKKVIQFFKQYYGEEFYRSNYFLTPEDLSIVLMKALQHPNIDILLDSSLELISDSGLANSKTARYQVQINKNISVTSSKIIFANGPGSTNLKFFPKDVSIFLTPLLDSEKSNIYSFEGISKKIRENLIPNLFETKRTALIGGGVASINFAEFLLDQPNWNGKLFWFGQSNSKLEGIQTKFKARYGDTVQLIFANSDIETFEPTIKAITKNSDGTYLIKSSDENGEFTTNVDQIILATGYGNITYDLIQKVTSSSFRLQPYFSKTQDGEVIAQRVKLENAPLQDMFVIGTAATTPLNSSGTDLEHLLPKTESLALELSTVQTQLTSQKHKTSQKIIEYFLSEGDISKTPMAIFTAGIPGSGKSFFVQDFLPQQKEKYVIVDPDRIRELLPLYDTLYRFAPQEAAKQTHHEATQLQIPIVNGALSDSKNLVVDGSLRDFDFFKKLFERIRTQYPHYKIVIYYFNTSPELAQHRVFERSKLDGRILPPLDFEQYDRQVRESVEQLRPYVDEISEILN